MQIFTERTIPVVIALILLLASVMLMSNPGLTGYFILGSGDPAQGQTLDDVNINYSVVAGIIIVLVALVSMIAYFRRGTKPSPRSRAKRGSRRRHK
jgi:hypothetical protein